MARFYDLPAGYYALLEGREDVVLLESGRPDAENRYSYLFVDAVEVLRTHSAADLAALLRAVQQRVAAGYYVAGYFCYECGYGILKPGHEPPASGGQPLAWLGVYRQPIVFDHLQNTTHAPPGCDVPGISARPGSGAGSPGRAYTISDPRFDLDAEAYSDRIGRIKEYILAGDTYQINFTGRYRFAFEGSPLAFYHDLRHKQRAPYSAYLRAAGQTILCLSPELFFSISGQRIMARPMKGTAPRGRTVAEDRQRADWLRHDAKNRAENVMIVDLLRNDLGRISTIGSVDVPELFTIEQYDTLFQMTSTVVGAVDDTIGYDQLFQSLFPCGSITGAPKIRSMEIIRELETTPRGVYTGSIGYVAPRQPAGAGRRAVFNVAIRTIVLRDGRGEMGVGSGIVADSVAAEEYAECAVKARFLTDPPTTFELLEAVLWHGGFQYLDRHLARLAGSAAFFGFPCDPAQIAALLDQQADSLTPGSRYKIRIRLDRAGQIVCESALLPPADHTAVVALGYSLAPVDSADRFLSHKTTRRALYDRASQFAAARGLADVIFCNERGEVTEGAIHNIFIEREGRLLTPPLSCGLLGGIYRERVLAEQPAAREQVLLLDDLRQAEKVYVCNAIRGWREARLDLDAEPFA